MAEKPEKGPSGGGIVGVEEGRNLELKLGRSFDKDCKVAFHSMRYDFKPASVDTSKMAVLDVDQGNSVTVTVPHVEGSGKANTVYKGNRRPCQKECVLIIDHKTGEITIEKLASNIQLKETRLEGSSKAAQLNRPHTPTEKLKDIKSSPTKKKRTTKTESSSSTASRHHTPPPQQQRQQQQQQQAQQQQQSHSTMPASQSVARSHQVSQKPDIGTMSDFSSSDNDSSSSDSSDSEPSTPQHAKTLGPGSASAFKPVAQHRSHGAPNTFMLSEDLQLSESSSDSD